MDFAPDFSAVLFDKESVKKLNMLLSPANALEKDVRMLSGLLGFSCDEVRYIFNKQYPFVYMLDQWIKRNMDEATLKRLHTAIVELQRPDAAEIVEKVVLDLNERNPKEIMYIVEKHRNQLKRSTSTSTLCTTRYPGRQSPPPAYEARQANEFDPQYLARQDKPPLRSTNSDEAPNVFVVYFPDHEKHTKNITRFIKTLRKSGVNATADMFESTKSANDRGFYIYSKLIEAEYVFVVCSPLFLAAYEDVTTSQEPTSEKVKEVSFIMKLILDDIFDKAGVNAKYIPVLMPKHNEEHVPRILQGSTIYRMPIDYEDLKRRVFKVEKYKLAPMPARRPNLKPKEIGNGFGLLKLSLS